VADGPAYGLAGCDQPALRTGIQDGTFTGVDRFVHEDHVLLTDEKEHRQRLALGALSCRAALTLSNERIDTDAAHTIHPARPSVAAALHVSPLPLCDARTDGIAAGRAGLRGGGGQFGQ
jgi:hypothetical protein